jgi:glycosyltransferase involved in cell wall biosynthesis
MKIAFISNYLNHHQIYLCNELSKLTNSNFTFISTEKIPDYRLNMGYKNYTNIDFNINYYNSEKDKILSHEIISSYDVVIYGSAPFELIKNRILDNKIVFHYSERLLKKGFLMLLNPKRLISIYNKYVKYNKNNVYLLSAGGYAFNDFNLFGLFKNRAFKWGYFPEFKKTGLKQLLALKDSQKQIRILWVGRLIQWKHPEMLIPMAFELNKRNINFLIDVIGVGQNEDNLKKLVKNKGLKNNVIFHGAMKPEKVRYFMNLANIFVFTSDSQEGWGAVLNEAMNSACAVVVSNQIGSVPYLIQDNFNGLIFKSGDVQAFITKVSELILNPLKRLYVSKNAYNTIFNYWNVEKASKAFFDLSQELLLKNNVLFQRKGPLSKAEVIYADKLLLK